jgi:hypothetical protein
VACSRLATRYNTGSREEHCHPSIGSSQKLSVSSISQCCAATLHCCIQKFAALGARAHLTHEFDACSTTLTRSYSTTIAPIDDAIAVVKS